MENLSVDIETYSGVDITKAGAYRYALDAEVMLFGYSVDFGEVQCVDLMAGEEIPEDVVAALFDPEVKKSAHNAAFERAVLRQHFGKYLPPEQWQCTQVMCARAGYPLSLDDASMALGTGDKKDKRGKVLIRLFSIPCKPTKANGFRTRNLPEHFPEAWQEFIDYCKQDVRTEQAIARKLSWLPVLPIEDVYWHENERMNERGVHIDTKLVEGAVSIDGVYRERLLSEAQQLTGLDNPNSRDQMLAWLNEEGDVKAETLTKESVKEMLAETDDIEVSRVLELRQEISKSSIRKYAAIQASIHPDGRVRGTVQFNGAPRTGRDAGRLIQVQNLARIHLADGDLSLARALAQQEDLDTMELLFGSVSSILSQLIRTSITAPEGKRLLVVDFSAVEARVIAWLAGEEWVLDVFRGHGKIYEATASRMFNVPLESITKDSEMRQRGKVAVLALGYGGGVNALSTMDIDKGIPDEAKPGLVKLFRKANPNIVRLWYSLERAALEAIKNPGEVYKLKKGVAFCMKKNVLLMKLPSGRLLHYPKPFLTVNRWENESIGFWGMEQQSRKWAKSETYGGKLAENCLAGDTKVLTDTGWKPIVTISEKDLLWDGEEWVRNGGSISKSKKQTIALNGIRMTGDHKILTKNGWKNASQSEGLYWDVLGVPDSCGVCGERRKKIKLAGKMRLRENSNDVGLGYRQTETKILRVYAEEADWSGEHQARHVQTPCLRGISFDGRPMQAPYAPSVAQLRGKGHLSMRKMVPIRNFLGRYGMHLQKGAYFGQDRRGRELRTGELPVDHHETTSPEQKEQHLDRYPLGEHDGIGSLGAFRGESDDPTIPDTERSSLRIVVREGRRSEPVYDIINSGPRNRFTVMAEDGTPVVVHNCTQAVARDLLMSGMHNAIAAGYHPIMKVHDELVCEELEGFGSVEELEGLMCRKLDWMGDLPLAADGFESKYYKK